MARRGAQLEWRAWRGLRGALAALSALLVLARGAHAQAPPLSDLPFIQGDLRHELEGLDAPALADFARGCFEKAARDSQAVKDVDWPSVLEQLRGLVEEQAPPPASLAYLDRLHAHYFLYQQHDCAEAERLLLAALARYGAEQPSSAWLALMAVDIERDGEQWDAAREHLLLAERALTVASEPELARAWLSGRAGELWIDLGMTDLARPFVAEEIERARTTGNEALRASALDLELKLLLAEEDFEGVDARRAELARDAWFTGLPAPLGDRFRMLFALCRYLREHRELAPRGTAAGLFDELLARGNLDPESRKWALRHRAICAADDGDWERARSAGAELATLLAQPGATCGGRSTNNRLGSALIALEARIAAAEAGEGAERVERLRPHFERLEQAWSAFLTTWSGAPVRGGGLAYLGLADHHLILQELIHLAPIVLGERAGAERGLEFVLQSEALSTLTRRMNLPAASLDEARTLTGEHRGVLVYVPLQDQSFAFALDARGVRLFQLEPAHRLVDPAQALAAEAQRAVRAGAGLDEPALRAAAEAAARVLLPAALEEHIAGWTDLLLIGVDDIAYVPFELLPCADGSTQGARRAIRYCPTIPVALDLARKAAALAPAMPTARLLLAPEIEPGRGEARDLPALVLSEEEERSLVAALHADTQVFAGREASGERMGLEPGESLALLHLLAHGVQDPARERPAGLLLAADPAGKGTMWAEDVEALSVPPLVVITACGAGRAPLRRGDGGRSDLAAAFLKGGALTVVLPTTDLELEATLRVTARFFEELARGATAQEALRRVRVALEKEGDGIAGLHANLLHVVGGFAPAWPPRDEPAPRVAGAERWLLVLPAAVALVLLVRRARRSRPSGVR